MAAYSGKVIQDGGEMLTHPQGVCTVCAQKSDVEESMAYWNLIGFQLSYQDYKTRILSWWEHSAYNFHRDRIAESLW